jgi:hypothetical protein
MFWTVGTNSWCQRRSVAASRALYIGPPAEHAAFFGEQRDVQFGLDEMRAVTLKLEVGVPGHRRDRALEEGMGVVEKARMARVFQGCEAAAGHGLALDRQHLQPGLAEIGLQDHPVVACAEDDAVVGLVHSAAACRAIPCRADDKYGGCIRRIFRWS